MLNFVKPFFVCTIYKGRMSHCPSSSGNRTYTPWQRMRNDKRSAKGFLIEPFNPYLAEVSVVRHNSLSHKAISTDTPAEGCQSSENSSYLGWQWRSEARAEINLINLCRAREPS